MKRLKTRGYGQIGFNYDQSVSTSNDSPGTQKKDDDDEDNNRDGSPEEAYVPHPKFFIPPNMELVKETKKKCLSIILNLIKFVEFIYSRKQQKSMQLSKKLRNSFQPRDLKWKFL